MQDRMRLSSTRIFIYPQWMIGISNHCFARIGSKSQLLPA